MAGCFCWESVIIERLHFSSHMLYCAANNSKGDCMKPLQPLFFFTALILLVGLACSAISGGAPAPTQPPPPTQPPVQVNPTESAPQPTEVPPTAEAPATEVAPPRLLHHNSIRKSLIPQPQLIIGTISHSVPVRIQILSSNRKRTICSSTWEIKTCMSITCISLMSMMMLRSN